MGIYVYGDGESAGEAGLVKGQKAFQYLGKSSRFLEDPCFQVRRTHMRAVKAVVVAVAVAAVVVAAAAAVAVVTAGARVSLYPF